MAQTTKHRVSGCRQGGSAGWRDRGRRRGPDPRSQSSVSLLCQAAWQRGWRQEGHRQLVSLSALLARFERAAWALLGTLEMVLLLSYRSKLDAGWLCANSEAEAGTTSRLSIRRHRVGQLGGGWWQRLGLGRVSPWLYCGRERAGAHGGYCRKTGPAAAYGRSYKQFPVPSTLRLGALDLWI